jgi:hypothetical protein
MPTPKTKKNATFPNKRTAFRKAASLDLYRCEVDSTSNPWLRQCAWEYPELCHPGRFAMKDLLCPGRREWSASLVLEKGYETQCLDRRLTGRIVAEAGEAKWKDHFKPELPARHGRDRPLNNG